uniref:Uncharacterized protein n=1 Tax=Cacopsylla melanoneura TaxID=428564 RepID=A0A8D8Q119_9HEMI
MKRIAFDEFKIRALYLDRVQGVDHETQTGQMLEINMEQFQLFATRDFEKCSTRYVREKLAVLDDQLVHGDLFESLNFHVVQVTIGELDLVQVVQIGERVRFDVREEHVGKRDHVDTALESKITNLHSGPGYLYINTATIRTIGPVLIPGHTVRFNQYGLDVDDGDAL